MNDRKSLIARQSMGQRPQYIKNLKDILKDKDKVRKISERAFQEIDTDHQGAISFNELYRQLKQKRFVEKQCQIMELPVPQRQEMIEVYKILEAGQDRILIEQFQVLVTAMLKKMIL